MANADADGGHEGHLRTALGRAYYAAYHVAKQTVDENNLSPGRSGGSHDQVISALLGHPDKRFKTIGNRLSQMKYLRHLADYQMHATVRRKDTKFVMKQAGTILDECSTH